MIRARTVHIGSAPPAPAGQAAGLGSGRAGDTLPARNPVFTGRAGALKELAERLAAGPVAVVAVRGLGGVGKSQLALEYAHRERKSGRYRVAGWVRADSAVTVAEDLAALGPLLGLPAEGTVGERAAGVAAALGVREDWLLVFDNAHRAGDLRGWLPGGAGHVLITSRERAWSGIAAQLDLDTFTREESVRFVCQRSGCDDPAAAGELADAVQDLPLALAQAAAYIDARSMTIAGYLGLYQDPALARRLRDAGLDSAEYPASVATTWLISFTQLAAENPAGVELLRLCAFLDPDDIDLDLLTQGKEHAGEVLGRVLGDPLDRAETAGALAAASLVTVPADGHLRVHRLVQAVTVDQLDDGQAAAWASRALTLITAVFPDDPQDHRSWAACASAAPHAEAVTGHAASSPGLARQVASLLGSLGIYLWVSAQLTAARATLQRALAIKEAAYGPDHPEVAITLTSLGNVQQELGELAGARATLHRALAIVQAAYGPDHPQVAITFGSLGIVQQETGDLASARATLQRALAIFQAAYGPDHPQVAITLTSLGWLSPRTVETSIVVILCGERVRAVPRASLGAGLACPFFLPEGPQRSPGSGPARRAVASAMRSSLEAGGAAPYHARGTLSRTAAAQPPPLSAARTRRFMPPGRSARPPRTPRGRSSRSPSAAGRCCTPRSTPGSWPARPPESRNAPSSAARTPASSATTRSRRYPAPTRACPSTGRSPAARRRR